MKKYLENYEKTKREIRDITEEFNKLVPKSERIEIDNVESVEVMQNRLEIYKKRLKQVTDEVKKIEDFFIEIEDPQIKNIFILRYVEGMTWKSIALQSGSYNDSYARNIHDRYLNQRQ